MLLITWNVASWQTTVRKINNELGISLDEYFERLGVDIFCIQEVKVNRKKLEGKEGTSLGTRLKNFESFWAVSTDKDSIGFQGVTTFVRKGLTIRANANPFSSAYLNSLGRCVVTEHENVIVFNVYVINRGEDDRLCFYKELFSSMNEYRTNTKKNVILAGDLNLNLSPFDRHFALRRVDVEKVNEIIHDELDEALNSLMVAIQRIWPLFLAALKTKTVKKQITFSKATNKERERFRLHVTVNGNLERIGDLYDSEDWCLSQFERCEVARVALVCELQEILSLYGHVFDMNIWKSFSDKYGLVFTEPSVWKLVTEYFSQHKMVDAHRRLCPDMDFRYTCWRQDKNMRFSNIGGKIDFVIIDAVMINQVSKDSFVLDTSAEAGLNAATNNKQFSPAPFEGGGLIKAEKRLLLSHLQKVETGFIYTPPTFSDHIALSLKFQQALKPVSLDSKCLETKRTQPFKKQKTINQFFKKRKLT